MNQSFIHYLNDTEKIKLVDSPFKAFNMIVTSTIKKTSWEASHAPQRKHFSYFSIQYNSRKFYLMSFFMEPITFSLGSLIIRQALFSTSP